MPRPFTPVSEAALQQISDAIDSIAKDPTLARTKRQIENIAGLSHATVARAFVHDAEDLGPRCLKLNERFRSLTAETEGKSLERAQLLGVEVRLGEKNREIKRLKESQAVHLQALYAYYLASTHQAAEGRKVVPIGANRPRGLVPS